MKLAYVREFLKDKVSSWSCCTSQLTNTNSQKSSSLLQRVRVIVFLIIGLMMIGISYLNFSKADQSSYYISVSEAFKYLTNNLNENTLNQNVSVHEKWKIQKKVWYFKKFHQNNKEKELYRKMNFLNTKALATSENYTFIEIDSQNYAQHLTSQAQSKITFVRNQLKIILDIETNSNLNISQNKASDVLRNVTKRLIIYHILRENGGIYLDDEVVLVQNLSSWLEDIMNVPFINIGDKFNSKIQPQCFGFFDPETSSKYMPANIQRKYEFQKKIVMFPAINDYFIACNKKTQFLEEVIQIYQDILLKGNSSEYLQKLNKNQKLIGKIGNESIYENAHLLSQHIVLQKRQHELNQNQTEKYTKLAIDDFGLITMNQNLGPFKLGKMFESQNYKKFSFLSKLTVQELEQQAGQLRFITLVDEYNQWLFGTLMYGQPTKDNFILQNSFFHRYFLSHILGLGSQELRNNFQLEKMPSFELTYCNTKENLNNSQWNALNRHVWVIWLGGTKRKSQTLIQLCIQNLRESAEKGGFQFHQVNHANVHQFLDQEILDRIRNGVKHATDPGSSQKISDLWRLALIQKHGGIYLDATTFQTDMNFDWLLNVTRLSSGFLWNRYGSEPNVVMAWNGYYGSPADWSIDRKHKTKAQNLLSLENNFIAAVKGSELINEWLDCFLQWLPLTYDQIQQKLIDVDIFKHKWITNQSLYLQAMESLKYVIAREQKFLNQHTTRYQNAHDYYKIWSFLGQMIGQQKFRGETNYLMLDYRNSYSERAIHNIYNYAYSIEEAESLLGPISFQTKFFGLESRSANIMIEEFYKSHQQNFTLDKIQEIIHPESFLAQKLLLRYPQTTLSSLEFYANSQKHNVVKCLSL